MKNAYAFTRIAALCLLVTFTLALGACSSTQTAGEQIDDAGITAAVKAKLAADGDINPFNIDVDTVDGVVTLTGKVAQAEARSKAESLARDTDGVKRVNNLITVGDSSR
ncbi:MAG TPA: BON domain-containing protein [Thermoanaerobaculia bacterium]|jgi:hyperosmotically inducible protein|nr:BON domain-containing protein [Thermoanaerobaculia bacterium]